MVADPSSSTSTQSTAIAEDSSAPPEPAHILNVNVGVLGHVDSGKTSLVKALSTLLSTAGTDAGIKQGSIFRNDSVLTNVLLVRSSVRRSSCSSTLQRWTNPRNPKSVG